jgi:hypothetical protein
MAPVFRRAPKPSASSDTPSTTPDTDAPATTVSGTLTVVDGISVSDAGVSSPDPGSIAVGLPSAAVADTAQPGDGQATVPTPVEAAVQSGHPQDLVGRGPWLGHRWHRRCGHRRTRCDRSVGRQIQVTPVADRVAGRARSLWTRPAGRSAGVDFSRLLCRPRPRLPGIQSQDALASVLAVMIL